MAKGLSYYKVDKLLFIAILLCAMGSVIGLVALYCYGKIDVSDGLQIGIAFFSMLLSACSLFVSVVSIFRFRRYKRKVTNK